MPLTRVKAAGEGCVRLTTRLYQWIRLRMGGAVPLFLLYYSRAWTRTPLRFLPYTNTHFYIYIYRICSQKFTFLCLLCRWCSEAYFPPTYILLYTSMHATKTATKMLWNPVNTRIYKNWIIITITATSCVDGCSLGILFTQNTAGRRKLIKDICV
jgi:hypothetical protein